MMRLLAAAVLLILGGCAAVGCDAGLSPVKRSELYLGRNIDGAPGVSDAAFEQFLDDEVTPRFPDGITVLDAQGRWRAGSGAIEREASKVLVVITSERDGPAAAASLAAISRAYKARFRQEAVLVVRQPACAAF